MAPSNDGNDPNTSYPGKASPSYRDIPQSRGRHSPSKSRWMPEDHGNAVMIGVIVGECFANRRWTGFPLHVKTHTSELSWDVGWCEDCLVWTREVGRLQRIVHIAYHTVAKPSVSNHLFPSALEALSCLLALYGKLNASVRNRIVW